MSEFITYNHGGVADFASDVGARSAQLMQIHDDIAQRTNAIDAIEFVKGDDRTAPVVMAVTLESP